MPAHRIASDGYLVAGSASHLIASHGYRRPSSALRVTANHSLTPSIAFTPTPDRAALASPQDAEFFLDYDNSTSVTLTAPVIDPGGYVWDGWYVGAVRQTVNKAYNFMLTAATTVEARYNMDYDITLIATLAGGSSAIYPSIVFSPTPDNDALASPQQADFVLNYDEDTEVTLTAPTRNPPAFRWWGWWIASTRVSWQKTYVHTLTVGVTIEARYLHNRGRVSTRRWYR